MGNPITEEYLDHGDYPVPKNQPAWTIDLNLTWYSRLCVAGLVTESDGDDGTTQAGRKDEGGCMDMDGV